MLHKIKHLFVVLLLACFAAQTTFAESLNQDDMAFAFGTAEGIDLGEFALLSEQEMRETEGQAIWFAPIMWYGARYALTGLTRHGLNRIISGRVSNQAILHTLRNPGTGSFSYIRGPNMYTTRYMGHVFNRSLKSTRTTGNSLEYS